MKKTYSETLKHFGALILNETKDVSIFTKKTEENIKAHQKNYIFSLIGSLKSSYSSVYIALGEDNFSYFSYQYIKSHPSRNSNIDLYGEEFPAYLESCKELEDQISIYYLSKIDWFLFSEDLDNKLQVPSGHLKLWESIIHDKNDSGVLIDQSSIETIQLKIDSDGEYYFSLLLGQK